MLENGDVLQQQGLIVVAMTEMSCLAFGCFGIEPGAGSSCRVEQFLIGNLHIQP